MYYNEQAMQRPSRDASQWGWSKGMPADQQWGSVNGLTATGKLVTLNGRDPSELSALAMEQSIRLLPGHFASETAFWDPAVVTDASGKATVIVTMPERSTAWVLKAKGINVETLAGQSSAEVITKKELFAEPKLPRVFTVGDQGLVPVEIHHSGQGARSIRVTLKATTGEKSVEQSRQVEFDGPAIQNTEFEVEFESAGEAVFDVSLWESGVEIDRTTQAIAVQPYGFNVFETVSGASSQSTLALIDFHASLQATGTRPAGGSLQISVGPSLNRWLLESILSPRQVSAVSPISWAESQSCRRWATPNGVLIPIHRPSMRASWPRSDNWFPRRTIRVVGHGRVLHLFRNPTHFFRRE
jgi:hypothetical protein